MNYPLLDRVRDVVSLVIIPLQCLVCGEPSDNGRPVCTHCLESFFLKPVRRSRFPCRDETRCDLCGRPLISSFVLCTQCREKPALHAIDKVFPLYPYRSCGQELLGEWKIAGMRGLSWTFAMTIATFLDSPVCSEALSKSPVPLVPVPPRPGKLREKGWDQVEELACLLEKQFGFMILRVLERTTSVQQKKLGRLARSTNLKGHISVREGFQIPETAILIDDLMTTGATLDACAEQLKMAGCRKVYGLTLFFD